MLLKENKIKVMISGYEPTMKKWDGTRRILENVGTAYRLLTVGDFFKRYHEKRTYDEKKTFSKCSSRVCHAVFEEKFSSCYFPLTAS